MTIKVFIWFFRIAAILLWIIAAVTGDDNTFYGGTFLFNISLLLGFDRIVHILFPDEEDDGASEDGSDSESKNGETSNLQARKGRLFYNPYAKKYFMYYDDENPK